MGKYQESQVMMVYSSPRNTPEFMWVFTEDIDGLLVKYRVSFKTSYYDIRTLYLGEVIVDKVMGTAWT